MDITKRLGYKFTLVSCREVNDTLEKMKTIIKEYGQVRVADVKELCGFTSTYTDNDYGWTELGVDDYYVVYNAKTRLYSLHLQDPKPLPKGCTYERVTENRYGYRCPHCQSLNIREVSSYHDAGDSYQTIGYQCTNCHTTFTIDVFDVPEDEIDMFYCGGRYGKSMEDTVAAYCKADCLSTQNMILARDKMELESELEKVKKELEEFKKKYDFLNQMYQQTREGYKSQLDWWHDCAMERYERLGKAKKELEETKILVELVKRDNNHLKIDLEYLSNFLYARLQNKGCITNMDLGVAAQIIINNYRNKED